MTQTDITADVLIIGSGISGLSLANMLAETHKVLLVEKNEVIGGLIKCERINGGLFHKVGGHVFNSRNQDVLNWFWNFFDKEGEFLQAPRNAKILIHNRLIGYPIEDYLYQLNEDHVVLIINELLQLKEREPGIYGYSNFAEFLRGSFGDTLYKLYFEPYNTKLWNTDLGKVPIGWLEGKLPMPRTKDIIINNILKNEESSMVHASFFYPKANGSQFIVNRLAEKQNIITACTVKKISRLADGSMSVNDKIITGNIVYTGDVRNLFRIVDIYDADLKKALKSVTNLPSNGTSNVFCETDANNLSWLYLPEAKFKAHRIIYTGNFSETNNNTGEKKRRTCVVEFSGKHDRQAMLGELSHLPGNLKPIAYNYEPNSYVIQQADTRNKIVHLKHALSKYNIYLLGRFAEWEYYNMDKCIESAMELNEKFNSKIK